MVVVGHLDPSVRTLRLAEQGCPTPAPARGLPVAISGGQNVAHFARAGTLAVLVRLEEVERVAVRVDEEPAEAGRLGRNERCGCRARSVGRRYPVRGGAWRALRAGRASRRTREATRAAASRLPRLNADRDASSPALCCRLSGPSTSRRRRVRFAPEQGTWGPGEGARRWSRRRRSQSRRQPRLWSVRLTRQPARRGAGGRPS